uniref:Uncharacterized protein n=1 Tax=Amphimedon queenslandica TaxID=400682 RepID=A0A1X7TR75_AMPQE
MSLLRENDSTTIGDVDTLPSFSIQDTSLINARKNLTTAVTIVKTINCQIKWPQYKTF